MMPNTVPNRPMNGPAEAMVARTRRFDSSRSTSRAIETSRTLSMRAGRPRNEPAACWNERFHSRMAATNRAAAAVLFDWPESEVYSSSSDCPDQKICSKLSISLLNLRNSRVLSKMIVQHQSEARKRPSIPAFTTMWADQNISRMLVSGVAAAAAPSAGFIGVGDLWLAGGTAGHGGGNGIGRGLRRKSAETWAFVR